MPEHIDIWKFIAGLGVFLFGMDLLEKSIKALAGRSFKLFLKRNTKNTFVAILSGFAVTAILQSSSVVLLITLAFVGAGIISMKNALGIIFGSNLGTTITGWIVVLIGFKFNIESFALPMIGIGGLAMITLGKLEKLAMFGQLLTGFGFLFLGLDFMKISVEYLASTFNLSEFEGLSLWVFLLVGFGFTAIIQSSSAMMVITLSALSSGIITFNAAASLVIGAKLGTTITGLIGGFSGVPAKKRVALGHFLFNTVVAIFAFATLKWLVLFLQGALGVKNELVALALFYSVINLIGIIIIVPFIRLFANFLENRFKTAEIKEGIFIHNVTFEVPEAAIASLSNETQRLIHKVRKFIQTPFVEFVRWSVFARNINVFRSQYEQIKRLEGEMFVFYNALQKEPLHETDSSRLNQLIMAIRYSLHAAKGFKGIEPDIAEFRNSTKSSLNGLYEFFKAQNAIFTTEISNWEQNKQQVDFENLMDLIVKINGSYDQLISMMTTERKYTKHLDEYEVSTVLTVNREVYSAYKALIMAMANYYLSVEKCREFVSLPSYK